MQSMPLPWDTANSSFSHAVHFSDQLLLTSPQLPQTTRLVTSVCFIALCLHRYIIHHCMLGCP